MCSGACTFHSCRALLPRTQVSFVTECLDILVAAFLNFYNLSWTGWIGVGIAIIATAVVRGQPLPASVKVGGRFRPSLKEGGERRGRRGGRCLQGARGSRLSTCCGWSAVRRRRRARRLLAPCSGCPQVPPLYPPDSEERVCFLPPPPANWLRMYRLRAGGPSAPPAGPPTHSPPPGPPSGPPTKNLRLCLLLQPPGCAQDLHNRETQLVTSLFQPLFAFIVLPLCVCLYVVISRRDGAQQALGRWARANASLWTSASIKSKLWWRLRDGCSGGSVSALHSTCAEGGRRLVRGLIECMHLGPLRPGCRPCCCCPSSLPWAMPMAKARFAPWPTPFPPPPLQGTSTTQAGFAMRAVPRGSQRPCAPAPSAAGSRRTLWRSACRRRPRL